MLTDAEIRVRESVVLRVLDEQSAIITEAGFRELMADFRTLQQQNTQMRETLKWYAKWDLSQFVGNNIGERARTMLQSFQGGQTNADSES